MGQLGLPPFKLGEDWIYCRGNPSHKNQQDEEVLLIAKTRAELVESELIPAVKMVHPYKMPEIIDLRG